MRPNIKLTALVVVLAAGFVRAAQTPATAKQPAPAASKQPATKSAATKSTPTKSAPAASTQAKSAATTKKPVSTKTTAHAAPPPVRHYTQQQPNADRFKEIQQALADRGYFKGSVDGQWGQESVEALKQFQREQKIDEDGKINSLSLIALGLGPHRNLPASQSARSNATPPPAAATEAEQTQASAQSPTAAPPGP